MFRQLQHVSVLLLALCLAGCSSSSETTIAQNDDQATAQAIVSQMQGASATADAANAASNTSDYTAAVNTARTRWQDSSINSYYWRYTHLNPAAIGQQTVEITVQDGEIINFEHRCLSDDCTLLLVSDQQQFTPQGVFDQLTRLAEQQHTMAIVRFDGETGLPLTIAADADQAPYFIQWNTDEFKPIE